MNLSWIILLHLICLLGLLSTEMNEKDLQLFKPKITRQYKPCTPGKSSGSKCVLQCSVTNAPDATLSIYNGTSLFSINKVADLNIDLILCMEVQHQDTNRYRCVVNNTHSSHAVHLNVIKLCELCPDLTKTPVPVTEGESVTLHSNLTKEQKGIHVMWMFKCNPTGLSLVAEILNNITSKSDCDDGRFKDRLHLDSETKDLTIINSSKGDSGVFKLQINNGVSKCWSFNVTVYALLPVPVITRNSSSSSKSRCSVLCSVLNVSAVSLSWYKGNSLLSSISVSDLSISLSLPLEVENQDNNTYSCAINNLIRNQTTHLNISDLCPGLSGLSIPIGIICGSVVGGVFLVLVSAAVIYHLYKHCTTKKGAGSQDQTSQNPQTGDGSQNQTSQNPQTANPRDRNQVENESDPLIPCLSSTQESIPLSKLCWK